MLGYVPTLLVVWSEASQHWSLQAIGWSQVLDTMSPARCQPVDKYSCLFYTSFYVLKKEPQLPPTSSGDPPRPAGRSGPGSYEVIALALGPSVHETLCASSKSGVSVSPSLVKLLRSVGLQSQVL